MKSFKQVLNELPPCESVRLLTDSELAKLKRVLLSTYLDVANVCEKYGLTIMLGGGSALGAVRHEGFIPWDDDLDALMPRSDYNRFVDIFDAELGDRYILNAPNYHGHATNRFPKIMVRNTRFVELGIDPTSEYAKIKIDIFILENIPEGRICRYLRGLYCSYLMYAGGQVSSYEERCDEYRDYMCQTIEGKKAYYNRIRIGRLFSFRTAEKWFDLADDAFQYNKSTNLLGIPSGRKHYFGEILPEDAFIPVSKGVFEGHEVSLPGNVDMYLKNLYGDYMWIPPEDKREKHFICDIGFEEE